jgi:hypothetical protein
MLLRQLATPVTPAACRFARKICGARLGEVRYRRRVHDMISMVSRKFLDGSWDDRVRSCWDSEWGNCHAKSITPSTNDNKMLKLSCLTAKRRNMGACQPPPITIGAWSGHPKPSPSSSSMEAKLVRAPQISLQVDMVLAYWSPRGRILWLLGGRKILSSSPKEGPPPPPKMASCFIPAATQ